MRECMCNYQLLANSKLGYIKRCDSCKKVKFVFGTISATMYSEDLDQIQFSLYKELKNLRLQPYNPSALYELPLDERISINMNHPEMEGLYEMIHTATSLVDLYSIIEVNIRD